MRCSTVPIPLPKTLPIVKSVLPAHINTLCKSNPSRGYTPPALCPLIFVSFTPFRSVASFASKSAGAVVNGAVAYSAIRAWGTPATLLTNVAQAACFGDKDAITPLRAVWIAGALNLVGDLVLVPWLGMGIQGAAIATVVAQYAGLAYIMASLLKRQVIPAPGPSRKQQSAAVSNGSAERFLGTWSNFSVDSRRMSESDVELSRHSVLISFAWTTQAALNPTGRLLELPSADEFKEFLSFAGPAFFALLGKVVTFSSLTYAAAAAGTVSLAAHQVVVQIWFFFCKFGDAVSSTAQTYIPGAIAANDTRAVKATVKRCMKMAIGLGLIDSLLVRTPHLACPAL